MIKGFKTILIFIFADIRFGNRNLEILLIQENVGTKAKTKILG